VADNSFWKGVVVAIVAFVGLLILLYLGMFLFMGRCPMCGRMMSDEGMTADGSRGGMMGGDGMMEDDGMMGGGMPEWMMSEGSMGGMHEDQVDIRVGDQLILSDRAGVVRCPLHGRMGDDLHLRIVRHPFLEALLDLESVRVTRVAEDLQERHIALRVAEVAERGEQLRAGSGARHVA